MVWAPMAQRKLRPFCFSPHFRNVTIPLALDATAAPLFTAGLNSLTHAFRSKPIKGRCVPQSLLGVVGGVGEFSVEDLFPASVIGARGAGSAAAAADCRTLHRKVLLA